MPPPPSLEKKSDINGAIDHGLPDPANLNVNGSKRNRFLQRIQFALCSDQGLHSGRAFYPGAIHLAVAFHLRVHQLKEVPPAESSFRKHLGERDQPVRSKSPNLKQEKGVGPPPLMS